jgi:hypothetical protein
MLRNNSPHAALGWASRPKGAFDCDSDTEQVPVRSFGPSNSSPTGNPADARPMGRLAFGSLASCTAPSATRILKLSEGKLAGATGLEPAASCVTGRRSNRLNYAPAY